MNKIEELLEQVKGKDLKDLKELLNKKQVVVEKEKKCSPLLWILAIVGFVAAVAGNYYSISSYRSCCSFSSNCICYIQILYT